MSEAERSSSERVKTALLWIVTILAAAAMGLAGVSKFTAPDMWNANFVEWGYSVGFKTVVGVLEITGAVMILIPRFATYGALLVCAIMLGAIYTVWANQSDLGFVANTGNLVLFAIIAYVRRNDRWMPGR